MKIAVYDTYVTKENGEVMHFDILVKEGTTNIDLIYNYGKEYLNAKGYKNIFLNAKECSFCHIEKASDNVQKSVLERGYYILEIEGC